MSAVEHEELLISKIIGKVLNLGNNVVFYFRLGVISKIFIDNRSIGTIGLLLMLLSKLLRE